MAYFIQKKQIFLIHTGIFCLQFFIFSGIHNCTILLGREPMSCTFLSVGVFSVFEGGMLAQRRSHRRTV